MPARLKHPNDEESDVECDIELRDADDVGAGQQENQEGQTSVLPGQVLEQQHPPARPIRDPAITRRFKARLFALKNNRVRKNTVNFAAAANRSYNYEEMYEEDEYGKETFPEARVWRVYNDETQIIDQERVDAWRDALDVLLVFIGLFSAIVTTFVVQTSQALQPDYAQMNVIVSLEILRNLANSTAATASFPFTPSDPQFGQATPSSNDKVVNSLWFTSLALSLSTALLTVVTKQWLYHFTTSTSGTSRERARIRQFRFAGLEAYQVPMIIDMLPTLLHLSLAFFLAGLALFLRPLHGVTFSVVACISGAAYVIYVASIILPLFDPQCPYKSPLSFYAYRVYISLASVPAPFVRSPERFITAIITASEQAAHHTWVFISHPPVPRTETLQAVILSLFRGLLYISTQCTQAFIRITGVLPEFAFSKDSGSDGGIPQASLHTLSAAEAEAVRWGGHPLDVNALVWLYATSANSTVRSIALEAFGGLEPSTADTTAVSQIVTLDLGAAVQQCSQADKDYAYHPAPGEERRHDRLVRALFVGEVMDLKGLTFHTMELCCESLDPFKQLSHYVAPCYLHDDAPWYLHDTGPWRLYNGTPWQGHDGFDKRILALFRPIKPYRDVAFPLNTWAAVLGRVTKHRPLHPFLVADLISHLHLPRDSSEKNAATLAVAVQHPHIRSIALKYLAISDETSCDVVARVCLAASPIISGASDTLLARTAQYMYLPNTSPHLSLLSSLFASLDTNFQRLDVHVDDSPTACDIIRPIFHDFLDSMYARMASWETLYSVSRVWSVWSYRCQGRVLPAITTPLAIRRLLELFYRWGAVHAYREGDRVWVVKTASNIGGMISICFNNSTLLSTAEALCTSIREVLPTMGMEVLQSKTGVDILWSHISDAIVSGTASLQQYAHGLVWFETWLQYIHTPERLVFFFKDTIVRRVQRRLNVHDLYHLQPQNPNWPACFRALLLLFQDQAYLDLIVVNAVAVLGNQVQLPPRQFLASELEELKEALRLHHDLSSPMYDIPQFDGDDNLISSIST